MMVFHMKTFHHCISYYYLSLDRQRHVNHSDFRIIAKRIFFLFNICKIDQKCLES